MRLRIRFSKLGKVRFTSHRDVARMWERAFRRLGLPLAYTGGFSPRPRVSFGLALPTGCESVAEYLDVDVAEGAVVELRSLPERLSAALPDGVDVVAVGTVEQRGESLQQEVTSCTWLVEVGEAAPEVAAAILTTTALPVTRERKGKQVDDDLRPAVRDITVTSPTVLCFELATQPRGVRPTELLAAVRPELEVGLVRRTFQWIERDGARREPLLASPATHAPHAQARAS